MNFKLLRTLKGIVLLSLLFCASSYAQIKKITGKVTDNSDGGPIPGVNVSIKGKPSNVSTNANGQYTIQADPATDVLVFSFIGFVRQSIALDNRSVLDVKLSSDVKSLDEYEVIAVGYGTKKRANVLGALNQIKTQEIEDFPVANLTTALKNSTYMQGVSVGISSGKPGAATSINVRNTVTFNAGGNTNPLFVIDGFQQEMVDFENLDITQVESIVILKDAAASIYGSKGANGVVLVTTKKGKIGKPRISYSYSGGVSDATVIPDMLSAYDHATVLNENNISRNRAQNQIYTQEELDYLKTHNYSWLDEVWQSAKVNKHTLNVSGGSDKVTYFAGGSYYTENGNLRDLYVNKYAMRIGMNATILPGLNASVSLATDNSAKNQPRSKTVTAQSETLSETYTALLTMPQWTPLYINGLAVYDSNSKWHPYELQNSGSYAKSKSQGVTLTASVDYKIPQIEGLGVRVNFGRNTRTGSGKEYYAAYSTSEFTRLGAHPNDNYSSNVIFTNQVLKVQPVKNGDFLYLSTSTGMSYQLNEFVTYDRKFGKHEINILAGAEQSESHGDGFDTRREGQVISGFDQLWGFSLDRNKWDNSATESEGGRVSYLSRLNYSFNNRYLLEGVFRADASPNFPPNSRWGYFPSVALGWKISEEPFFKNNLPFFNDFKVRLQLGLTGNDNTANYQYRERYTQTSSGAIVFGDTQTSGLDDGVAPNPHITWEKAFYKNLGFDGSFANRRWNFSVDLYHRRSYDMLEAPTSTLPSTYANTVSVQNHGEVKSWGIEYRIGYDGNIGKDFKYSIVPGVGGRWTNDNKVITRYVEALKVGTWQDPNGRRTSNSIDGYKFAKMMRTQDDLNEWFAKYPNYTLDGQPLLLGDLAYEDIDGDGKINSSDIVRLVDRPANVISFGCNFQPSYKGFRLQFGLSASFGGYKIYEKDARTAPNAKRSALTFWKDAWTVDNPNGKFPAIDDPLAKEDSDFWIRKNKGTLSVGNVQASYALPQSLTSKFKLQQLRLFCTVSNLWDFGDPLTYKYSGSNKAYDYPAMRTVSFGLNVDL